jgi:hypothetical protein
MGDNLVAEQVEIDPLLRAPPLGASEELAIEASGSSKIVDRKRKVKRRQAHALPLLGTAALVEAFVERG